MLPISEKYLDYAEQVRRELAKYDVDVTVDSRAEKIGYKIREARMDKIPYMLVVGQKEAEEGTVSGTQPLCRRRGAAAACRPSLTRSVKRSAPRRSVRKSRRRTK